MEAGGHSRGKKGFGKEEEEEEEEEEEASAGMQLEVNGDELEQLRPWIRERCEAYIEGSARARELFEDFVVELLVGSGMAGSGAEGREWMTAQLAGLVGDPARFVDELAAAVDEIRARRATRKVEVRHVPERCLTASEVQASFAPFGAVVACRADLGARAVVVEFARPACAIRCTKAATRFFNNRFVEVQLYHGNAEEFGDTWLIGGGAQQEAEQEATSAPGPAPEPSFTQRVKQVQNAQQVIFEKNQRSKDTFKQDFAELFESKEKLLRTHHAALQELRKRVLELDGSASTAHLASEFRQLQESMRDLGITPAAMVELKVRKFNLDHPSEFPIETVRTSAKRKKPKRSAFLRKRVKRKR